MSSNGRTRVGGALRLLRELEQELGKALPLDHAMECSGALGELELLLRGAGNGQRDAHLPATGRLPDSRDFAIRYQELFDFAMEAYLVTDMMGVIVEANHAAASLLQVRKEFLLGKPLPLFASTAQRAAFYSLVRHLQTEVCTVRSWPTQLHPPWGQCVEVLVCVAGVAGDLGQPVGLRWMLRDVTPLVRTERALRAERDFAESLLDNAQVIVLVLEEGRILRANLYTRQVLGYGAELLGQPYSMLLPREDHALAREMVQQALLGEVNRRWTTGLLRRDGQRRVVDSSAKALVRGDGGTAVVLIVGHDITELEEAQQQVLQAERLAALGRVMARLAHESRNLLQRSQACLERLSWRVQDRPEAVELVGRLQQIQRDLAMLFEDVRGYAAPLRIERAECDVREIWREAWEQIRSLVPGREATLHEDCEGVDTRCRADRFRLLQVFRNLMDNSFAACSGPVRIEIICRDVNPGSEQAHSPLQITFRDNGPGLGPEQRKRLFEPFYTTRTSGSGLGMTIAKRIMEAHGGQIVVGEKGPPGAEFIVTLARDST